MAANNPYTSTTISGYNASAPPDDGTRDSTNLLKWSFHTDKIGDPLKTGIESVDTNVAAAFDALIVTDDPAQEGMIEAMRRFMPRVPDERMLLKRLLDRVESPLSVNQITINAVFS